VRHGPGHRPERELEILCLVAAGASNGQVASAMNISGHTVAGSLRSMLSRTRPATGPGWPAAPRRPGFAHPYLATAGWPRVLSCHGPT